MKGIGKEGAKLYLNAHNRTYSASVRAKLAEKRAAQSKIDAEEARANEKVRRYTRTPLIARQQV